jgi:hypothetical protein
VQNTDKLSGAQLQLVLQRRLEVELHAVDGRLRRSAGERNRLGAG